jgi:hypothetical protein
MIKVITLKLKIDMSKKSIPCQAGDADELYF